MAELNMEWRNWVEENILLGVLEDELVRILLDNHFHAADSHQVVREYAIQHRGESKLPEEAPVKREQPLWVESESTYERRLPCMDYRKWPILAEITDPIVIVYGQVLTHEECDRLIAQAMPKLEHSTTVDSETGNRVLHEHRTSQGTFFQVYEDDFIRSIEDRLAELMNQPVENGEGLQILNYKVGGEYKPHFDYFPPDQKGSHVHIGHAGQRVATLILYLNEPEEGGETIFPEINLKVRPVKGAAAYFSYLHQGKLDPRTLHGGAPVIRGEKWIATKWVREQAYSNING